MVIELMPMVWVVIFTLVSGFPDGRTVTGVSRHGSTGLSSSIGVQPSGAGRTPLIARRVEGRRNLPPWSSPLLEDLDSRELDESGPIDLDALSSSRLDWLPWGRPGSTPSAPSLRRIPPIAILSIPLRC